MASHKQQSSAQPQERPPAEQVARENYKREFGTTKPDAALPPATEGHGGVDSQEAPISPAEPETEKES